MAVYTLSLASRVPQAATSPTLTEVGPIYFNDLTWVEELNKPGSLQVNVLSRVLPSDIKSRLVNLRQYPSELWLFRDTTKVFAGPVVGRSPQGEAQQLIANGLLYYLQYMILTADVGPYTATDQFTIAKALVDHHQAKSYGHFGINTGSVGTSGVTRTRPVYAWEEIHNVAQRLEELGRVDNGFDFYVDPSTRNLVLSYPSRGSDLSASVFFDGRNLLDPAVAVSVAAGDLASDGIAISTGGETTLTSIQSASSVQQTWGLAYVATTVDGVTVQATLDGHATALRDGHDEQLLQPGGRLMPLPDVAATSFNPGDTVRYDYDDGVGTVSGNFRVVKRVITVDKDAEERISAEFA